MASTAHPLMSGTLSPSPLPCILHPSAVDNILLKLADLGTPFLRLGRSSGVHEGIRPFLPGGERYPDTSVAGLHRLAAEVPVVRRRRWRRRSASGHGLRPRVSP